jgi:hypothetical protein
MSPATLRAKACPACDAPLSRAERTEGWCDSCGLRLPNYVTARRLVPGDSAWRFAQVGRNDRPAPSGKLAAVTLFLIAGLEALGGALLAWVMSGQAATRDSVPLVGLLVAGLSGLFFSLGLIALARPRGAAIAGRAIDTPLAALSLLTAPLGLVVKLPLIIFLALAVNDGGRAA